jgi:hypothetical protein
MKKISRIIATFLLSSFLLVCGNHVSAQPGGVPDDPSIEGTKGAVGHPVNKGANIDGGVNIFMLLALAYGTRRYINDKRKAKKMAENGSE